MNYLKKILRTNRKAASASAPSPIYSEINKLLKEHDFQNEINCKFFEVDALRDGSPPPASSQNTDEMATRTGSLLSEILTAEFRRSLTKTNNERVHRFMKDLLESGLLDVNLVRNFLNQTILHTATENNDLNLCRLLVSHGANYLSEDNYRQTPLILAAKRNFSAVLRVFADDIKQRCNETERLVSRQIRLATYHACYSGNSEIVRYLFDNFALTTEVLMQSRDDLELELTSNFGKNKLKFSELNPLHVCCYKANFEIVQFLLARLDDKTQVAAIVNSPINEYRDSTSLEEAFKGFLMFDLNNEIDLKSSSFSNGKQSISSEYSNRQEKKKNYKKIINLLIEHGARFSVSFINNNGMCKLLTQVFTGPNKDADFVHFLACTNYLFKFKLEELFVYDLTNKSSPSTSISSLTASQESLMLMITQKGMLLSDANDLSLSKANNLAHMIDEFMFKVYLLCLRVIKDYKGVCINYFIDTIINLHYSEQSKIDVAKLSYLKDKNAEIYEFLVDLASRPMSLKSLSSNVVRRAIPSYGIEKVNQLAIPNTLKYEVFFNSLSKGYCINFDYYSYFLYKQLSKTRPV